MLQLTASLRAVRFRRWISLFKNHTKFRILLLIFLSIVLISTLLYSRSNNFNYHNIHATQHSFNIPSDCSILPAISGSGKICCDASHQTIEWESFDLDSVHQWRANDANNNRGGGQVAVLFWDKPNKQLLVALHQRASWVSRGKNMLGLPGGKADNGEMLKISLIRELNEEAMNGIEIPLESVHLGYISRLILPSDPIINGFVFANYFLFVNDKQLVTGPDANNQNEMNENRKYQFFKSNGLHNFFAVRLNENGNLQIDGIDKSDLWWATEMELKMVLSRINCT